MRQIGLVVCPDTKGKISQWGYFTVVRRRADEGLRTAVVRGRG
jgi:hypothetical protein